MGSDPISKEEEKKTKEKRRKKSPSSADEGERKRHRTFDKEAKTHKSKSETKHKSHGSSKHHSGKDSEMKSEGKHKSKHHKHDRHSKLVFEELSTDDYFSRNNEFATWLKEDKDLFFSDLSSDSARNLFSQFVEVWNNQKLESKYYEGITTAPRTSHKWKIK